MVALLVLASAAAYVLRLTVSIAAPAIKADLGLSEVQLGIVLSAFMTTYAVFQVPGGAIGERLGPRLTLTALFAGWGIVTVLIGVVPGPAHAPLWICLGSLL